MLCGISVAITRNTNLLISKLIHSEKNLLPTGVKPIDDASTPEALKY